jgi:hypothetical protein
MEKRLSFLLIAFLVISITGCGSRKSAENANFESISANRGGAYTETVANDVAEPQVAKEVTATDIAPKVIKTANVSIEVFDYLKSRQKVDSIVAKHKGYITNEAFQETDTQKSNSITIRVPAQNFDQLLSDFAAIAKKVDYQNIYTQDVTEEYIDVKTRLINKLEVEKTYRKHLREAKNIEDILKIENKLAEIRSEIESAEGRLKYIDHQVNLSTVSLYLYQKLEYKYIPEELPGFWQRVKEGIHWGWKGFLWFLILLVKLWPLWLLGIAAYFFYIKIKGYLKNRKKKEKKAKKLQKKTKLPNEPIL